MSSVYGWKGRIERAEEVLVMYKSRVEDFDLIVKEIEKLQPYETPCIEMVEATKGNPSCLEWLMESTGRPRAGSDPR